MNTFSDKVSRKITAAEVKQWFGNSKKARLRPTQYEEIATCLTKYRWPSDPPAPPDAPWLPKIIEADSEADRWWDFQGTTAAAKLLLQSAPAMIEHWKGLLWAPETRGGYEAIKDLKTALVAALHYIEWPFGEGERTTGQKRPKDWHLYAQSIARIIINEMVKAGQPEPGITRNSVVVRVVHKALVRMGIPYSKTLSDTAIGAYLTRWDKKFGLTPQGIAILTTK
jgi:hypothetical protein